MFAEGLGEFAENAVGFAHLLVGEAHLGGIEALQGLLALGRRHQADQRRDDDDRSE